MKDQEHTYAKIKISILREVKKTAPGSHNYKDKMWLCTIDKGLGRIMFNGKTKKELIKRIGEEI